MLEPFSILKQSICKTRTKDVITRNSLAARCNGDREDREGQRWQLALDLAGGDVVGIGTRLAAYEDGRWRDDPMMAYARGYIPELFAVSFIIFIILGT